MVTSYCALDVNVLFCVLDGITICNGVMCNGGWMIINVQHACVIWLCVCLLFVYLLACYLFAS